MTQSAFPDALHRVKNTAGQTGPSGAGPGHALPENSTESEQTAIERYLRRHARRYCPGGSADPQVMLLSLARRPASRVYWYRIGDRSESPRVVVKVPGNPEDSAAVGQPARPRLVEPPPLDTKYARECEALDLLQRHFSRLNDPRFGAVPLLDRIEPARAIVMGEVQGQPLTHLAPQLAQLYLKRPSPLLRQAVENAGAWLREYHGLDVAGAMPRQASREEFVTHVHRYCSHLGAVLSRPDFFAALAERITSAAGHLLPRELPLGLGHGDFAMRNLLVAERGRVVVFDTTALWRTPIYADLAKFTLAVRLSRIQVYSHGLAFPEAAFKEVSRWLFAGYYGAEPVPQLQISLYGLLLLLDQWSSELARPPRGPGVVGKAGLRVLQSWYTGQALRMVRSLDLASRPGMPGQAGGPRLEV